MSLIFKIAIPPYNSDFISSFLECEYNAHRKNYKTEEWFKWKFGNNTFGEPILAIAFDDNKVVGCVAFGIINFANIKSYIKAAMSYETFVHTEYQNRGIFKNLIQIAEIEAASRDIDVLINYPNSKSLTGFIKSGWKSKNFLNYWIKIKPSLLRLIFIGDIRKGFSSHTANHASLSKDIFDNYKQKISNKFYSISIDEKYLDWRFLTYPNNHYVIFKNENINLIGRSGMRGHLRELHILNFQENTSKHAHSDKSLLQLFKKFDIVTHTSSDIREYTNFFHESNFFKISSKITLCYKVLNNKVAIDIDDFHFDGISMHTY